MAGTIGPIDKKTGELVYVSMESGLDGRNNSEKGIMFMDSS